MTTTARTFRVFVSSTFGDSRAERDALQRHVWPALKQFCTQLGARFQAIDLRWGVSAEAGLDQQTMPICLEEIRRCRDVSPRPNFIILLGDRHGWRPLPSTIPATEFEAILATLPESDRTRLLWEPVRAPSQNGWYRRDDNAVPPEYVLLPRDPDDPLASADGWAAEEHKLRGILERGLAEAVRQGLALEQSDRLKYEASATEQEIYAGAFRVDQADEHVHAFFRSIDGLPAICDPSGTTADSDPDPSREFADYLENGQRDREAAHAVDRLKSAIVGRFGTDRVHEYTATWLSAEQRLTLQDGTVSPISLDHVEPFCLTVFQTLASTILREMDTIQATDALDQEAMLHAEFGQARSADFRGRLAERQAIAADLRSGPAQPMLVHGASGSGKSAFLGQVVAEAWATHGGPARDAQGNESLDRANSGAHIISRFIGVSPESSDIRTLLTGLCRQISRTYGQDATTIPADFNALVQDFWQRLGAAAERPHEPLLIFLDALDQLASTDNARNVYWLPNNLPANVHVVVTALSDPDNAANDCFKALSARLPYERRLELLSLESDEADALLGDWLAAAVPARTLTPAQSAAILGPAAARTPLYLKLAFEEARRWHSYDDVGATPFQPDIQGIIRDLFNRLKDDSNHGPTLVERSLALLAASRNGLAEDEMLELLSPRPGVSAEDVGLGFGSSVSDDLPDDWEVLSDYFRRSPRSPRVNQLPVVLWSRLSLDLQPYLSERAADGASLLGFFHRQIREVVEADYLREGEQKQQRHRQLAEYFADQPLDIEPTAPVASDSNMAAIDTQLADEARRLLESSGRGRPNDSTEHLSAIDQLKRGNRRKLAELPYQQTLAHDWDAAFATLTNFDFLERKAATGEQVQHDAYGREIRTYTGVYDIQADYALALERWPRPEGDDAPNDGPGPIILTATDFQDGQGYRIRCPICHERYPLIDAWLGQTMPCPGQDAQGHPCRGRWKVNLFTAPPRQVG